MARARRSKRRARDARGHFIKKKRKSARKPAVKRRKVRRSAKRASAKRVTRVKRALGRKKSNGRFVRRAKHRVRGFRRRTPGRRRRTLVRSHLSYEKAPKKRRRRRARRAMEESVMKENPRRRRRSKRRHHRKAAAENPVKRKRRKARRSPRRRRAAKRRTTTAVMPAIVRRSRKGGKRGSARPATVKVVIANMGRRSARKRRGSARRRRKGSHSRKRRKGHARRKHKGYTSYSRQLPAGTSQLSLFENPLGGNFMENPLSGGELVLAAGMASVGFVIADFIDRIMAVRQYMPATVPTGATPATSTSQAIDTKPSWMRILTQLAVAAAPLAGAYYVHKPMARAALQGAGLGALVHLGSQLLNHFGMAKLAGSSNATLAKLQPYYQQEIQADSFASTSNLAGFLGATPALGGRTRVVERKPSIPRALAAAPKKGVAGGECLDNGDCNPCTSGDNTSSTAQAAADAIAQESGVAPPVASGSNGSGAGAMSGIGSRLNPYGSTDSSDD